jgi:hypothetical protein
MQPGQTRPDPKLYGITCKMTAIAFQHMQEIHNLHQRFQASASHQPISPSCPSPPLSQIQLKRFKLASNRRTLRTPCHPPPRLLTRNGINAVLAYPTDALCTSIAVPQHAQSMATSAVDLNWELVCG